MFPTTDSHRFTGRVRRVFDLAESAAQRLRHAVIGPEHVLIGLLQEGGGVAAEALGQVAPDLTAESLESFIAANLPPTARADEAPQPGPYYTHLMEITVDEAIRLSHFYVGSEHLLLGLVRVQFELSDAPFARMLAALNIAPESVREAILRILTTPPADALAVSADPTLQPTKKTGRRFTDRSSIVMQLAHSAAQQWGHAAIAPEHILIAMLREEGGVAGQVLSDLGLSANQVGAAVVKAMPLADYRPAMSDLSSESIELIKLAGDEAQRMQSAFIGTEHLLLALARLPSETLALRLLATFNITPETIRHTVQRKLSGEG
jgi:ATP-dependent Clp protease ATP-binding subunit ClpA